MSSLTDIIFLLLIFFMLTSTLVKLQPFDLPRSDSKTVAATSAVVTIDKQGKHTLNGRAVNSGAELERGLTQIVRDNQDKRDIFTVTIAAEVGTPFDHVVSIMKMASRLRVKAIIATQPKT
jgi:biopolymer transport protein ExbD